MFSTILSWLASAVSACFDWLATFFSLEGGAFNGLFIAMFVVFMAVRFLIIPLVGTGLNSGVSDSAEVGYWQSVFNKNSKSSDKETKPQLLLTGKVTNPKERSKKNK